jgi:hypothetical protein
MGDDPMWTFMQQHFPTLSVALPRAARSLPGAFLIARKRLRGAMTRRRMIAAAVLGLTAGLIELPRLLIEERRRRFDSVAAEHESKMIYGIGCSRRGPPTYYDIHGRVMTAAEVEIADWHAKLARKYRAAAAKPWLPVEPDPPPP